MQENETKPEYQFPTIGLLKKYDFDSIPYTVENEYQFVSMESVINSSKFQNTKYILPLALGKMASNEVYIVDLAEINHLLIAGGAGYGFTDIQYVIITSLLYRKHPKDLKFLLIDAKTVDFEIYKPLKKYFLACIPTISDSDDPIMLDHNDAMDAVESVCQEVERRFALLQDVGAQSIKEYNEKCKSHLFDKDKVFQHLPSIVVIINEYGDFMMTAREHFESQLVRLSQNAHIVGIHIVLITQRPTGNSITEDIKAKFCNRIALRVNSQTDSYRILNESGAENLMRRGDMLIKKGNVINRVQCASIEYPEINAINDFIVSQDLNDMPYELPTPSYRFEELIKAEENKPDPLIGEVAKLIVESQKSSASFVQRKMSLGYNRVWHIMNQLEAAFVIGPVHGSIPREVLVKDMNTLKLLLSNWIKEKEL